MIDNAVKVSLERVTKGLKSFKDAFPEEQSRGHVYRPLKGVSWTEGFWTGMLWLAYELSGKNEFKTIAENLLNKFKIRLSHMDEVNTHDLGFLYSLSCVAAYKLTGNTDAYNSAVKASDLLVSRYQEKGQFIQAWGDLNTKENYRLIIDCLLNIPLLYWAGEVTGKEHYTNIAKNHLNTTIDVIFREDFTTYHTYYFDIKTGEKLFGETHQGYSDDSCWARGQAWGVYGIALSYAYTKDERLIPIFNKVTECFLSMLPEDNIPYWDMIFTSGNEPRDTSAAAIAICGILEMNKYQKNEDFMNKCMIMMKSLCDKYLTDENSNGILTDGMYSRPRGDNPECNIWGDYFFMEALMRLKNPDWHMYW